jgi:flavorubredoxin
MEEMNEEILEARREYYRTYMARYRKENPEKIKEIKNRFYIRQKLKAQQEGGQ